MMISLVEEVEEAVALVVIEGEAEEAEAWDATEMDHHNHLAGGQISENPLTVSQSISYGFLKKYIFL